MTINTRLVESQEEVLESLQYDLLDIEQQIEDEYEKEDMCHSLLNSLQRTQRLIKQDIAEIKMFWNEAAE